MQRDPSESARAQAEPGRTESLPDGARLGAVVSSYHAELTEAMFRSAADELERRGLPSGTLVRVDAPGAFELPLIARRLGVRDDIDAVLCLGLVLKGETSHDRHIASAVAHALQRVSLDLDKPVLFGVLTCDTLEQARARATPGAEGGRHDKGREVARAAVVALNAMRRAAGEGRARATAGFGAGFSAPAGGRP